MVVENFKVGGLAKYGLDYASLKQANPCTRTQKHTHKWSGSLLIRRDAMR